MDYLLSVVGVAGFLLAGNKVWWAWWVNVACQGLWVTYALTTGQYGFLLGAAFYTVTFGRNAIKWTREHREKVAADADR